MNRMEKNTGFVEIRGVNLVGAEVTLKYLFLHYKIKIHGLG